MTGAQGFGGWSAGIWYSKLLGFGIWWSDWTFFMPGSRFNLMSENEKWKHASVLYNHWAHIRINIKLMYWPLSIFLNSLGNFLNNLNNFLINLQIFLNNLRKFFNWLRKFFNYPSNFLNNLNGFLNKFIHLSLNNLTNFF